MVHVDTIPPTVEISNVPDIEKNEAFDITITFSEPVNGFQAGDIDLTGPATVHLTVGGDGDSVYTARITPNASLRKGMLHSVFPLLLQKILHAMIMRHPQNGQSMLTLYRQQSKL